MRNLQEIAGKIIDNMSITFDIKTDIRYKQGREEGREERAQIGEIIKIIAARNMIMANLDPKTIARFLEVSVEFVEKTKKELEKEKEIREMLNVKRSRVNTIAKKLTVSPIFVRAIKKIKQKEEAKKKK